MLAGQKYGILMLSHIDNMLVPVAIYSACECFTEHAATGTGYKWAR